MPVNFEIARRRISTKRVPFDQLCEHKHLWADETMRALQCKRCKQVIDAFDFLSRWARNEESLVSQVAELEARRKRLVAEIDELRRQERNAKARLSRAGKET
jgi:hypothetical protein